MNHRSPLCFSWTRIGVAGWLAATLFIVTIQANVQAQYEYTTNADNTITVTGYTGSGGDVTITNEINGLPVSCIGSNAFCQCTNLTSVVIPDSVTNIEYAAFEYCSLTNIIMGNRVADIGECAFAGCGLTSVTIPNGVTGIGVGVFESCASLTNVMIGNGLTNISFGAFMDCTSLPSITIPDSITSVREYAFCNCSSLTSVILPNSVTSIGEWAFAASGLTSITIPDGIVSIEFGAFYECYSLDAVCFQGNAPIGINNSSVFSGDPVTLYCLPGTTGWIGIATLYDPLSQLAFTINSPATNTITIIGYIGFGGAVTVPNEINNRTVTSIGSNAFWGCTDLTSITISSGVTIIGDNAFYECTNLTSVYFTANAPGLDTIAFTGDHNVTVYYLSGTTGWSKFFDDCPTAIWNIFSYTTNSDNTLTITGFNQAPPVNAVTIPNTISNLTVTCIGSNAFYGCTNLTSVVIPDSVTNIAEGADLHELPVSYSGAFADCFNLTNITIGNSVINIGDGAFFNCISLTSVTIPNSVTTIGDYAFDGCWRLTSATIGISITSLGSGAFGDCGFLTSVYFRNNYSGIGSDVFGFSAPFVGHDPAIIYYLPGSTGWSTNFAGCPTALWLPQISASTSCIQSNKFGFNINWASGRVAVVESCTNLATSHGFQFKPMS